MTISGGWSAVKRTPTTGWIGSTRDIALPMTVNSPHPVQS